jgi:hypothetical protein
MSSPQSSCPNCGAPVAFRWSSSVQTVCEYCRSILVRTDVDLRKVGEVADLPQNASPIQLGSEGVYNNRPFSVAGRIIYEYEQGSWNEWHIIFNDGASGWLADAQLDYTVSFLATPRQKLPRRDELEVGRTFQFDKTEYQVTSITRAHYAGVEGELPFEYWDKQEVPFADLRSRARQFGTIDYSEEPPLLFLGESVDFDFLKLRNLREFEGWAV